MATSLKRVAPAQRQNAKSPTLTKRAWGTRKDQTLRQKGNAWLAKRGSIIVGPYRGKSAQAKACATAKQCKPRPYQRQNPHPSQTTLRDGAPAKAKRQATRRDAALHNTASACQAAEEEMEPASSSERISRSERIRSSREIWLRRNWMRKWYAESGEW